MSGNGNVGRLCYKCGSKTYAKVEKYFYCLDCKKELVAAHGGDWKYCPRCARKDFKCQMCGEKI